MTINRWARGGLAGRLCFPERSILVRRGAADESGQALIETALTLPLLLLLMVGIIQCGLLFNNWVMLTDAVRAGARQLSTAVLPGQNACQLAEAATRASAPKLNNAGLIVTSVVTSSCTSLMPGSDATLTATYPCELSILGINYAPGCRLRAQTTERVDAWTVSALPAGEGWPNHQMPFELWARFAANPNPVKLADEASLRPIRHQAHPHPRDEFSSMFLRDRAWRTSGVERQLGQS